MFLKLWAPLADGLSSLPLAGRHHHRWPVCMEWWIPPLAVGAGSWCCPLLSPQERMALERRIPTKLSALKDRLIAAFDKSLYLSSHSREIAWTPQTDTEWKVCIRKVWTFQGRFYKCNTNSTGALQQCWLLARMTINKDYSGGKIVTGSVPRSTWIPAIRKVDLKKVNGFYV